MWCVGVHGLPRLCGPRLLLESCGGWHLFPIFPCNSCRARARRPREQVATLQPTKLSDGARFSHARWARHDAPRPSCLPTWRTGRILQPCAGLEKIGKHGICLVKNSFLLGRLGRDTGKAAGRGVHSWLPGQSRYVSLRGADPPCKHMPNLTFLLILDKAPSPSGFGPGFVMYYPIGSITGRSQPLLMQRLNFAQRPWRMGGAESGMLVGANRYAGGRDAARARGLFPTDTIVVGWYVSTQQGNIMQVIWVWSEILQQQKAFTRCHGSPPRTGLEFPNVVACMQAPKCTCGSAHGYPWSNSAQNCGRAAHFPSKHFAT